MNLSLMTDLGFEKSLILVHGEDKILHCRVNLGFSPEDVQSILTHLEKNKTLRQPLEEGHTFSSVNSALQEKEEIVGLFDVKHFILTPILIQNSIIGVLLVGNRSNAAAVTEGDEELVSVLANQIGQSLDNARFFEQAYRASQAMEFKVKDRTRELESALDQVKHINKTKSEFISAVSHELRTPLTSIKGYAAILIAGKLGNIPAPVKERLEKINAHSDNLVKLINNLLDIARIESGRAEMQMEKCSISSIIENVHDLLAPQMKEKNIQWQAQIPEDMTEMVLDKHQIERVFINLVGNAIKFTPEKGTIGVSVRREADTATLEVSDTGIGIPKEDLNKLFDEFYRVDNEINQNVKGTGLGLSLAKKIVEAHKGRMWVTSELSRGTTFYLTLPA